MKSISEIGSKIKYYEEGITENNKLRDMLFGKIAEDGASEETIKHAWEYVDQFHKQNMEFANCIRLLKWVSDIYDD